MKNIDKIKNATASELVDFIATIREEGDHYFSDYYCSKICKYRTDEGCPTEGEDGSPCDNVSWKDEIAEWLEAEE